MSNWDYAAEEGRRQAEINQQLEAQRQNEAWTLYAQRQAAYAAEQRRQEEARRQQEEWARNQR